MGVCGKDDGAGLGPSQCTAADQSSAGDAGSGWRGDWETGIPWNSGNPFDFSPQASIKWESWSRLDLINARSLTKRCTIARVQN